MAANPWLAYFDRKLWAHIQVVLSVAIFLLAWQVVIEQRRRAAIGFFVLAALQLLSHTLALVQGLSWLAALLVAPRRWLHCATVLGVTAALLLLTPYALALWNRLEQSAVEPLQALRAFASQSIMTQSVTAMSPTAQVGGMGAIFAHQLLTGSGLSSVAGLPEDANIWWLAGRWLAAPLIWLMIALGSIVLGRSGNRRALAFLFAWLLAPSLLLAVRRQQVFLQYWTVLLPLPALLFALGVGWMAGQRQEWRHWQRWLAAWLLPAGITLIWIAGYLQVLEVKDSGGGTPPLRAWRQALTVARQQAQLEGVQEVRIAVNGVDPGYDSDAAVTATLIGNPPYARFLAPVDPPALLLAYQRPSLHFWGIDGGASEAQIAQLGQLVWRGERSQGQLDARLYRLAPFTELLLEYTALSPPPAFGAGLQLLGYEFPMEATARRPFTVTLFWRVLDPPWSVRERDMTAFNHILAADSSMVWQMDGLALLSRDWWPDDVLLQRYSAQLPTGVYVWRTGIYSRSDGGRAITDAGKDSVDLPGLQVGE
jgi:hypothetical protein